MTLLLNGFELAKQCRAALAEKIKTLPRAPKLAVILAGSDPASAVYVKNKEKAAGEVGIESAVYRFETITQPELLSLIRRLNADDGTDGILVQLPLPKHINKDLVLEKICPTKDVDCFHPYNIGKIATGNKPYVYPCTPKGIIRLLEYYDIKLEGKNVVIVGRSNIVGRPLSQMMLNENATVTVCHSRTKKLSEITKQADILVSAAGKSGLIKKDMVKEGAVVVDVGMNRNENGKLCGDVDFEEVETIASYITPVPGGVGPMTICSLMVNTYDLFNLQNRI